MGRPRPRRPQALRIPDPGGHAGRVELAHDPQEAREFPPGVRRLRPGQGGSVWQAGHCAPDGRRGHREARGEDPCRGRQCRSRAARSRGVRIVRQVPMGVRRRQAQDQPLARDRKRPRDDAAIRRDEPRLEKTRLQVRGIDDLLRPHAGDRHGERPHHLMLSISRAQLAAALAVVAVGLNGCATVVFNPASNAPLSAATPLNMGAPTDLMRDNSIPLSFSGGGLRAAAFTHGVLTALESVRTADGDLLDDVALISSVSGSALTAAYYGVYGREGLARFRNEVLLPGFESGLRPSLLSPSNLMRLLGGGLNIRENFGDQLDRNVFHGATFADIFRRTGPEIRIQATDLYYRVPFPFLPVLFSMLCSDLSRYSVADAVAASMAVPVLFAPVVVRSYPDNCEPLSPVVAAILARPPASRQINAILKAAAAYRDPAHVRFIKLADGGLSDNFGVSNLTISRLAYGTPYPPMTERDAVKIRRLLLIVVDASQGPNGDWTHHQEGPSGLDLALSATDAAVDVAARLAADALGDMIQEWQDSVVAFRCGLKPADVVRLGGPADWNCADVKFSLAYLSIAELASPLREHIEAIPTRLSLKPEQVDETIQGAREETLALPRLRRYLRERVSRPGS